MKLSSRSALSFLLLLIASIGSAQSPGLPPGGYKAGFPASGGAFLGGKTSHGQPAIADLGLTPGHKSIIFGTFGHRLYVVNYDGTIAPGFPVTLPADVLSSPAIGDLDGDGIPEIVVGYGSTLENPSPGGVRAFRRNGTVLWDRPSSDFNGDGVADPVMSTPAIGDVDGDGLKEVAWGSLDAHVYLVRGADGVDKPGWPHFVRDTIFSSPALADLDGNGKLEVIIGADAHAEGPPFNTPNGGCLHAFRFDASEVPGFPQCIDQVIISSPAVGDIDGDGKPEIVVGTGMYYSGRRHALYAFRCDGSSAPGWPVAVDGQVIGAPALADLDGDGLVDVIATDDNSGPSGTYHVSAFKGNGTLLWRLAPKNFFGVVSQTADPMVADILGDSKPEVIVPTNTEVCVISSTGVQLTDDGTHAPGAFTFYTDTGLSGVAVGDFETDNAAMEVVAVSATPFPSATDTKVFVWTPKAVTAAPPWGMLHHDPQRHGVVPGTPSCAGPPVPLSFFSLTPCRVADTRGPAGAEGGPALSAGRTRDFPVRGICGVPAGAKAIAANVTVTGDTNLGDLRLYPSGLAAPGTSVINFRAGQTRANNAVIGIGSSGSVSVTCDMPSGTTQFILDVFGYLQ